MMTVLQDLTLITKRIDHSKEPELVKIRIGGSNLSDAVLSHQGGDMKIVEAVAGDAGTREQGHEGFQRADCSP